MPVPKHRRSKSKKRIKSACWKIETPQLRACPSCGTRVLSHRACSVCGTYKGKVVIAIKQKAAAATEE